MILLIDNYDSFSYNVYQLAASFGKEVKVLRNDAVSVAEALALQPSHIIISPGPGRPAAAGICEELIRKTRGTVPILGICLGHQAICEVCGGTIMYAKRMMHGKRSTVRRLRNHALFKDIQDPFDVGRYHSLAADKAALPSCLEVLGESEDGEIMAVAHKTLPLMGVQFHPESILTPQGPILMRNFLNI